jgi:phenylalanyl-tRNA synthetase beta chain
MKISYRWLHDYLDFITGPGDLASILTGTGLEVESHENIHSVKGGLEGVVVGEVITCIKHPASDHLSVTTVDVGRKDVLRIVCGAPNVDVGMKVPVATVGTVLYDGDRPVEIKKTTIRGELSEGMICAEDELGLGPSHEGVMELDPSASVGMAVKDYLNLPDDHVYDIGLTPNRTDAMSHIGVARDLMAVFNNRTPYAEAGGRKSLHLPSVDDFRVDNHDLEIKVTIDDKEACPRYSGVSMTGIRAGESPLWLKNKLTAVGIRPINNIVDISNYILQETGQPLHIFDADTIEGRHILVTKLPRGTRFTTLDGIDRELTEVDLMICNQNEGMCIAGVFGGIKSGVTERTRNIFIESAHFNPKFIRRTSKYHGLQTDASFHFERGVDPNGTLYGLKRAAILIKALAGGIISSDIVDKYPRPCHPVVIEVRYSHIYRLTGQKISPRIIRQILSDLGMHIIDESRSREGFVVSVPTYRFDVTREADVIEEILRIYGYDNIDMPSVIRMSPVFSERPDRNRLRNLISDYLTDNGFFEIMNNSLTSSQYIENVEGFSPQEHVRILNPISHDLSVMRQTLLFGGLETIRYNVNRKMPDMKMYEFGTVYFTNTGSPPSSDVLDRYREYHHLALFLTGREDPESWQTSDRQVGFYDLKAVVGNLLQRVGIPSSRLTIHTCQAGLFDYAMTLKYNHRQLVTYGRLKNNLLIPFDIRQEVYYADFEYDLLADLTKDDQINFRELPKYPEVRRDLALLLPADVQYAEIEKIAFHVEKKLLKAMTLFDVYEGSQIGEGKKSYAISFTLQSDTKTLTDKEVEQVMNRLMDAFKDKLMAVIR